ncbi:MAG: PhoH family protein [Alphaproteobacteria bacterium]|nr:MAG: PhoH family protein [Alphaproteobacteria bacterium]
MGKNAARLHAIDSSASRRPGRQAEREDKDQKPRGVWDPLQSEERREQSYIRRVRPQNPNQSAFMDALASHSLTIGLGPAGTGKTYLAIAAAVEALEAGRIERILLSRPAIEAGESIGFLPGDLQEKMAPYLRPLYDALNERMGGKRLRAALADGTIEIAPIGYMRGRTLNNAFIVIDEAQNCTYGQLKMLLTRLGWHSTMVLTGDPDQSDLLQGVSGLSEIARRLDGMEGIVTIHFTQKDVVRHPLVARMLTAL